MTHLAAYPQPGRVQPAKHVERVLQARAAPAPAPTAAAAGPASGPAGRPPRASARRTVATSARSVSGACARLRVAGPLLGLRDAVERLLARAASSRSVAADPAGHGPRGLAGPPANAVIGQVVCELPPGGMCPARVVRRRPASAAAGSAVLVVLRHRAPAAPGRRRRAGRPGHELPCPRRLPCPTSPIGRLICLARLRCRPCRALRCAGRAPGQPGRSRCPARSACWPARRPARSPCPGRPARPGSAPNAASPAPGSTARARRARRRCDLPVAARLVCVPAV